MADQHEVTLENPPLTNPAGFSSLPHCRWYRLFALTIAVLFGFEVLAEEPTKPTDSTPTLSAWLKGLIDSRRLTLDFYEPGKPRSFPGWTVFAYQFQFKYDCQVTWPQKKPRPGPVTLVLNFTKIDVPITHRMELPKVLEGDRWFEAVLARHELEHVRVGSHPRLVMLAKHLVKKIKRLERTVEKTSDVTQQWIQEQVEAELKLRKDAIEKLVMDINEHIDKVTEHGALALNDREHFFANLYLKENLDEMKFPFLAEVLDLIETQDYEQVTIQTREFDSNQSDSPKK